ncbi:MAG TPA: ParB/RepB/Spo0J family partition protein [Roseobacter sp.]|uniref:ParB-like N-terminal domain-containing protein n=1 Tax=marine sediment metagenome TaxID=412755 RepID=A0A0F9T7F8_9ZZZZ|nr:ParB/RepB/Spo0J family partition protein [Roseobacter sp.]
MAERDKRRGLGRGLSALMADVTETQSVAEQGAAEQFIPIEKISPNPEQPRKRFDPEDLQDLANSIREKGVIQPLIVRRREDGTFEIVAGERRWRASQMAQLHELPVIIREFTDVEVLEVAIIENIQRADLNSIEEAAGYRQLMDRFGHTQEKMAEALGKSRSHIANLLRLLNLPDDVLEMVRVGDLSAGHARTLVPATDPSKLAKQIVAGGLSVRATEALMKREQSGDAPTTAKKSSPRDADKDADTRALEGDLSANLGIKVTLNHKSGQESGQMVLHYKTMDELDEICRLLSVS